MKNYIFEGTVTALSSIAHGGGERLGIRTLLRREKRVQLDGTVEEIPIISGNSTRGRLRDEGMRHACHRLGYGEMLAAAVEGSAERRAAAEEGLGEVDLASTDGREKLAAFTKKQPSLITDEEKDAVKRSGLPLPVFYFLFSGGALTGGGKSLDLELARKIRQQFPLASVFGGAIKGMILPGKFKCGKMTPICQETVHLLPERFGKPTRRTSVSYALPESVTSKALAFALYGDERIAHAVERQSGTIVSRVGNRATQAYATDVAQILADSPYAEQVERLEKLEIVQPQSIWGYLDQEFYVRTDDAKRENLASYLAPVDAPKPKLLKGKKGEPGEGADESGKEEKDVAQQMIYYTEVFCAGTPFHWKLVLEDLTDMEFEAFAITLACFSKSPYVGGKSAVGLGEVAVKFDQWFTVDSRITQENQQIGLPLGEAYLGHLATNAADIRAFLQTLDA